MIEQTDVLHFAGPSTGRPQLSHAPKCPNCGAVFSISQNEPTAAMPWEVADAPKCPIGSSKSSNSQNEPKPLTPRQLEAVNLLFDGATFSQVCHRLHVNRKTLFRWRESASFKDEVRRRYRDRAVARKPPTRPEPILAPSQPVPASAKPTPRDLAAEAERIVGKVPRKEGEADYEYYVRCGNEIYKVWKQLRKQK
jgi:transposase-like protein